MDSTNDGGLLGIWNHGIHRLQYQSTNSNYRGTVTWFRVDYAVHFTTRLEEEVEHNPRGTQQEWVENASATTGRAMFGAALTTAGGFAVLNLSALLPLRLFGQAFVVAITLALLSSLILIPAFYTKFLNRDAKKYLEEE